MLTEVKGCLAAVRFLTVLPVASRWCDGERPLRASTKYFPLVGLGIGGLIASADHGLGLLWQAPLLTSGITTVLLIAISGGLHIDGLADTADGFLSARPKQRILEIMRDSRIGVMGTVAVVSAILLKFTALAAVNPASRWTVILLMPLAGRTALLCQLALLPYARSNGGLADLFIPRHRTVYLIWAAVVMGGAGWLTLNTIGLFITAVWAVGSLGFAGYCYRKIGGLTGDTLGAGCEFAELLPLLTVLICEGRW